MKTEGHGRAYAQNLIANGQRVSLSQILTDRESVAQERERILSKLLPNQALISFSLNIPGAVKKDALYEQAFQIGCARIEEKIGIDFKAVPELDSRYQAFYVVSQNAGEAKKQMIEIEETDFGRLLDIDVYTESGELLSRKELGYPPRKCFICNQDAKECARSRKHPIEEVIYIIVDLIYKELDRVFCEKAAELVEKALRLELETTPKPGLVDRNNTGAHDDMTYETFLKSIEAIRDYFVLFTGKGMELADLPDDSILNELRELGKEAERSMYEATGNVNCHKGAIFSFGIITASMGVLYKRGKAVSVENVLKLSKCICAPLLEELEHISNRNPETNGEKVYAKYGAGGIRREAAEGFPTVSKALSFLEHCLETEPIKYAGVRTLLSVISVLDDTCILSRSDIKTLHWAKKRAQQILQRGCDFKEIESLDQEFIQRHISPGGAADLLAITYFCVFLKAVTVH